MTMSIPKSITTTVYASNLIVKTIRGTLHTISGYSSKTSEQFIQVYDSKELPANGAIPKIIIRVPQQSNFVYDLGEDGRFFTNGIVVCNSSTATTLTIGSADCWFDIQYK